MIQDPIKGYQLTSTVAQGSLMADAKCRQAERYAVQQPE
jgi:hypothetical protein